MYLFICCWISSALISDVFAGQLFTSIPRLQAMALKEDTVLSLLGEHISQDEERFASLRSHLKQITPKNLNAQNCLDYMGHPINQLHLLTDWLTTSRLLNGIPNAVSENEKGGKVNYLTKEIKNKGFKLPTKEDYDGGIRGLTLLQRTYDLSTEELAEGVVAGKISSRPMDISELSDLASAELKANNLKSGVKWLKVIISRSDQDKVITQARITASQILYRAGLYGEALSMLNVTDGKSIKESSIKEQHKICLQAKRQHGKRHPAANDLMNSDDVYPTKIMCGNYTRKLKPDHRLICRNRPSQIVPYIVYKEEILHMDPHISIYYDVISDNEVSFLKREAFPEMETAGIYGTGRKQISTARVGETVFIDERNHKGIQKFSKRVADILGLSTEFRDFETSAENFQIATYGMGGQFASHFDYIQAGRTDPRFPGSPDRIGTFMFYLNRVEAGGATIFSDDSVDLKVDPVKNSAVFWYNYHRSGIRDTRVMHAACPVLLGEKWVANKWIHAIGNEFNRPCGLHPDDTDPL